MTTRKLLATALCLGWLVPSAAMAQAIDLPQSTSNFNHRAATPTNSTDVAIVGTVQKVTSEHVPGAPAGLHLLLNTQQGVIDVHLGPYVAKDIQESLSEGQPVQVIGISQVSDGETRLLARELMVSGRQVTIRNEHGFLVRPQSETARLHKGQSELNGGNQ